jgi:hypothetical protein
MNKILIILGIYLGSVILARVLHRKLYHQGGLFDLMRPGLFDMTMIFAPGLNSIWAFALVLILTIERLNESKSIKEIAKRVLGV